MSLLYLTLHRLLRGNVTGAAQAIQLVLRKEGLLRAMPRSLREAPPTASKASAPLRARNHQSSQLTREARPQTIYGLQYHVTEAQAHTDLPKPTPLTRTEYPRE